MNIYQSIEGDNPSQDMWLGVEALVVLPPLFLPLQIELISAENTPFS
jgi:hypothetical protein